MPTRETRWETEPVAVLFSGGLDSAILLGELAVTSPAVYPLYVRFGLVWEDAEEEGMRRYARALEATSIHPPEVFEMPLANVYGKHWSTTGQDTPDENSADEEVYLPGRNLLLLAQTAVWCDRQGLRTIAMAALNGNPFSDSSGAFFRSYESALRESFGKTTRIVRPYGSLSKSDILGRAGDMPIHETFSCICPVGNLHCGRCNKCAERQRAFSYLGIVDPTRYATRGRSSTGKK